MKLPGQQLRLRRRFLQFLAASPLLSTWDAFAQKVEQSLGASAVAATYVLDTGQRNPDLLAEELL